MRVSILKAGAFLTGMAFASVSNAGSVTFVNPTGENLELHVRNGPIAKHPDNRGSKNTTMKPSDVFENEVGDGDTWFAYGNQIINNSDNPELCNAKTGQKVMLDKSQSCFVNN